MGLILQGLKFVVWEDVRLHEKGNSKSHGARPVYYNDLDEKVNWTSRVSIKNSLSVGFRIYQREPSTWSRIRGLAGR